MIYVDRGDPATFDFTQADLILDMAPHDLDLSAIVPPAGANQLVHLMVRGNAAVITSPFPPMLLIRKKGNANWMNVTGFGTQVSNLYAAAGDVWVMLDANRVIEYRGNVDIVDIVVRGWMEPC